MARALYLQPPPGGPGPALIDHQDVGATLHIMLSRVYGVAISLSAATALVSKGRLDRTPQAGQHGQQVTFS